MCRCIFWGRMRMRRERGAVCEMSINGSLRPLNLNGRNSELSYNRMAEQSGPRGEGTEGQEGLGSPLAEIDGQGHAVAVVASEDQRVFAARMRPEDGAHLLGEKNGAGPAMRDARGAQRGMQIADTGLEPAETLGGFTLANIEPAHIERTEFARAGAGGRVEQFAGRSGHGNEAGAKNDASGVEHAAPQIGEVNSIKRAAQGKANGFELGRRKRRGGQCKGEFGCAAQPGQFEREGVGGEKDLTGENFFFVGAAAKILKHLQTRGIGEVDGANLRVLHDLHASAFCRARETGKDFAGVDSAARDEAYDPEIAGVVPRD